MDLVSTVNTAGIQDILLSRTTRESETKTENIFIDPPITAQTDPTDTQETLYPFPHSPTSRSAP